MNLSLADQGSFFAGITRTARSYGTAITGQMHVQYQVPSDLRHPHPVVMVHGGGGQALDFLATPDGRPGWATLFLRRGYAVYVVDRPGMGRSPYHPDLVGPATPPPTFEGMVAGFAAEGTQWPGSGVLGDPALDQFLAGQEPLVGDMASAQEAVLHAGTELLERIGPAVLLTHSMGAAFGWLVADARPRLVTAIVAVEPIGPPFLERPGLGSLDWGPTSIPLAYDPPVGDPAELRDGAPRRLPNLSGVPVVVVTAEASSHAEYDHAMVDFLARAGVPAEHLRLADHGIHGNGHLMMLERNNVEVAGAIWTWLESRGF